MTALVFSPTKGIEGAYAGDSPGFSSSSSASSTGIQASTLLISRTVRRTKRALERGTSSTCVSLSPRSASSRTAAYARPSLEVSRASRVVKLFESPHMNGRRR